VCLANNQGFPFIYGLGATIFWSVGAPLLVISLMIFYGVPTLVADKVCPCGALLAAQRRVPSVARVITLWAFRFASPRCDRWCGTSSLTAAPCHSQNVFVPPHIRPPCTAILRRVIVLLFHPAVGPWVAGSEAVVSPGRWAVGRRSRRCWSVDA